MTFRLEGGRMKNNIKTMTHVFLTGLAACLLYAVSAGIRSDYGIMLTSISDNSGVAYGQVSLVLAISQLVFGIMQPVFGIVALKKSNRFVLMMSAILMALGMFMIPYSTSVWTLMLALGIILPAGTGGISFGIIMGAVTLKLGEQKAATVSGLVNAASGLGGAALSSILRSTLSTVGLGATTFGLTILFLLLIPMSLLLGSQSISAVEETSENDESMGQVFKGALSNKNYLLLIFAFFTCGFHMVIIETHLYSQFVSYGISETFSAFAYSGYGVATIIGAVISGILCSKLKMKNILAFLYSARAFTTLLFLLAPKTPAIAMTFAVISGLTGASTISPTSGIVGKMFGSKKLGVLFGFAFFSHQVGGFLSASLGGLSVEMTGGYVMIWTISIILCVLAGIATFIMKEE